MTPDDYTDPTKWMELTCGEPPPMWHIKLTPSIPAKPKPESPGESGFDLED
jgi:hypothetical protein